MPCCGDREKGAISVEEKWDYINLDDFKSESCMTIVSYIFVYIFLLVSLAVYCVDIFTAVNLLAFSRWAGQIKPAIPFTVSRWIFAACIIISFVILIIRWLRAIRAMRSGSIARSYMDPLAVRIQSVRVLGRGRGWKRFLVFAELTKSRKGAEYVALYSYFAFGTWMNVLLADGPRQVVNGITLWSVMRMDLLPGAKNGANDNNLSAAMQFFNNIKILAEDSQLRAVILVGMVFTVVIWVLSVLKLASAIVLYLIFLFHHIPPEDGTLSAYCRRKISSRLKQIVTRKVNKALLKGFALQERAPTKPSLLYEEEHLMPSSRGKPADIVKEPTVTTLSRTTTLSIPPPYSSRPGTVSPEKNQDPTLPDLARLEQKNEPSRADVESSGYLESAALGEDAVTVFSPLDHQSSIAPLALMSMPASLSHSQTAYPSANQLDQFNPSSGRNSSSRAGRYNPTARPLVDGPDYSNTGTKYNGLHDSNEAGYGPSTANWHNPTLPTVANTPEWLNMRLGHIRPNCTEPTGFSLPMAGRLNPSPPVPINIPGRLTPEQGYGGSEQVSYCVTSTTQFSQEPYCAYSPVSNPNEKPLDSESAVLSSSVPLRALSGSACRSERALTPRERNMTPQQRGLGHYAATDPPVASSCTSPPHNQVQPPVYYLYDENTQWPRSRLPPF